MVAHLWRDYSDSGGGKRRTQFCCGAAALACGTGGLCCGDMPVPAFYGLSLSLLGFWCLLPPLLPSATAIAHHCLPAEGISVALLLRFVGLAGQRVFLRTDLLLLSVLPRCPTPRDLPWPLAISYGAISFSTLCSFSMGTSSPPCWRCGWCGGMGTEKVRPDSPHYPPSLPLQRTFGHFVGDSNREPVPVTFGCGWTYATFAGLTKRGTVAFGWFGCVCRDGGLAPCCRYSPSPTLFALVAFIYCPLLLQSIPDDTVRKHFSARAKRCRVSLPEPSPSLYIALCTWHGATLRNGYTRVSHFTAFTGQFWEPVALDWMTSRKGQAELCGNV